MWYCFEPGSKYAHVSAGLSAGIQWGPFVMGLKLPFSSIGSLLGEKPYFLGNLRNFFPFLTGMLFVRRSVSQHGCVSGTEVAIRPRGPHSPGIFGDSRRTSLRCIAGMAWGEKLQVPRPGSWQIVALCPDGPLNLKNPHANTFMFGFWTYQIEVQLNGRYK